MKTNKLILTVLAAWLPAAAVFAGPVGQQQLIDAVRNGEIATGEAGVPLRAEPMPVPSASPVVRERIQGATIAHGEIGTAGDAVAFTSTRTREEVRAEAIQAVRSGEILAGEAGTSPVGRAFPDSAFARRNSSGHGSY